MNENDYETGYQDGCDTTALTLQKVVDARDKRIAELKKQLIVTRKYSYGDGYERASIEFSGRIALLEEAGTTMAGNLLFLADHLTGRIGEGAQAEMIRIAEEWLELVPQETGQ
jgi:hypothetical protein